MNQKHREMIDLCCQDVVPKINIIKLWPKLFENKIFNRDDVNISHWKVRTIVQNTKLHTYIANIKKLKNHLDVICFS